MEKTSDGPGDLSVTELAVKATRLLSHLPEQWYKRGSELEDFKAKLSTLSQRSVQWERQSQRLRVSGDPVFRTFLVEATNLVNEEEEYHERHKQSWVRKFKRRHFPTRLTYILSNILGKIDMGLQLSADGVETQEETRQTFGMDSSLFPFGNTFNYVPLPEFENEVRRALEDPKGQQVVTLYGEAGLGKSQLAKYMALYYQDLIRKSASLFDGVHYLFCGQGCRKNIHQLRKELFTSLGLGTLFSQLGFDATTEQEQGSGEDYSLSSFQSALRRLLTNRKLLIILDEVWREDFEVLANLISIGTPTKYLVTSRISDIWHDAWCIQIFSPTYELPLSLRSIDLHSFSNKSHQLEFLEGNPSQGSSRNSHFRESSSSSELPGSPSNREGSSSNNNLQLSIGRSYVHGSSSRNGLERSPSKSQLNGSPRIIHVFPGDLHLHGPPSSSSLQRHSSNGGFEGPSSTSHVQKLSPRIVEL